MINGWLTNVTSMLTAAVVVTVVLLFSWRTLHSATAKASAKLGSDIADVRAAPQFVRNPTTPLKKNLSINVQNNHDQLIGSKHRNQSWEPDPYT